MKDGFSGTNLNLNARVRRNPRLDSVNVPTSDESVNLIQQSVAEGCMQLEDYFSTERLNINTYIFSAGHT